MFADTWCPVPASPSSSSSPASDTRLEGRRDTAREVALLLITDVAREVAMVLILVTSFTLGRSDAESNGALRSAKRVLPGNQIRLPAWCCPLHAHLACWAELRCVWEQGLPFPGS
jgi:hypothetical protein